MVLRRTPFARAAWTPKPRSPARPLERRVVYAGSDQQVVTVPKHVYIRSPALMKAFRQIPCQNCGRDDGTVCGAHSNQAAHGKGKAIKADDNKAASLCFRCHTDLDQGSEKTRSQRLNLWSNAHRGTVRELVARGLWPADVPIPDIRRFNA